MPTLDTGVISDIGGSQPDFAAAQSKALTLADLYDTNKLNKMKIAGAEQEQSDMTYAKQILQKGDLSKLEDQNAAVSEITKRSPKLGMELARSFSGARQDKNEEETQQLKLYGAKNDIIGGALYQLKEKHDQILAQNPKATEQQIHDAMAQDVIQTVQGLAGQKLPNGQPLLDDNDRKNIKEKLGQGYNVAAINDWVSKSAQAKEAITQKLKQQEQDNKNRHERVTERQEDTREKQEDERVRHDRATEANAKAKLAMAERKAKIVETQKSKGFSDAEGDLMASLAVRGVSLPAGLRSKEQQMALLSGLLRKNPNDSPDELAEKIKAGQLDFGVQKKETTTAAGQAGKIAVSQKEVLEFGQLALEASAKVPRGEFVPYNQLSQMGERNISDPDLKRFFIMNNALLNAYDSLAARGGTDKDKRKENRHNAEIADSQETYAVAVQAMKDEAAGAERAAIAATRPIGAGAPAPGATNAPGSVSAPASRPGQAAPPPPPGFVIQGST